MSTFWVNGLPGTRDSSPVSTIVASVSVASSLYARTVISASPGQGHGMNHRHSGSKSGGIGTPSSMMLLKAPRSSRVSFFTSKFRLFKARRTTTSNTFVDPSKPTADLTGLPPPIVTSNNSDEKSHVRSHRAMTVPTRIASPPSTPLIGLGLVGLEYDSKEGKYWFKDSPRTPSSAISSLMGRHGSQGSFGSTCTSPTTPSVVTAFLPTDTEDTKDDNAFESRVKDVLRCSDVDHAAMAGILGVLFPPGEPVDERTEFYHSLSEGSSPANDIDIHLLPYLRSPAAESPNSASPLKEAAAEPEESYAQFAYLVQSELRA